MNSKPVNTISVWKAIRPPGLISLLLLWCMALSPSFAQCTLSCYAELQIALNAEGMAILTPSHLIRSKQNCGPNLSLEIIDAYGQTLTGQIDCAQLHSTLTAIVRDEESDNACSTTLQIVDNISPIIQCKDTSIFCLQSAAPAVIGYPEVFDNCSELDSTDLNFSDVITNLPCFTVIGNDTVNRLIERHWFAEDASGNTTTCLQRIYLKRVSAQMIQFPADRDGVSAPRLDCSKDDPLDLNLSGQPLVFTQTFDQNEICRLSVWFSDQTFADCGQAKKIFRTWNVYDDCTDTFQKHIQKILLADLTPPVITCPKDTVIGTSATTCETTINLPRVVAIDDCSSATVTPSWVFGTGYGPYENVPPGRYTVWYIAEDGCGNRDSCDLQLELIDDDAPAVICDQNLVISLQSNGKIIVPASIFDDGSYDNCQIDRMEVSRDGIAFGNVVEFDCTDLKVTGRVSVSLRVYDWKGQFNTCTVQVSIVDNEAPRIECPADITLSCSANYQDLELAGRPVLSDNCSAEKIYFTDREFLNACNIGTVTRHWFVTDAGGQTRSCTQIITLEDTTSVKIIWPQAYESSECGARTDTGVTGYPVVIGADCKAIEFSYTDLYFNEAPPACYRIVRQWMGVDWCVYNPNDPNSSGVWNASQLITIKDLDAPQLISPKDTSILHQSLDCSGVMIYLEDAVVMDCNPNVVITNNSPFADASGANASGFYPPGVHTVTFTASDGCGNSTTSQLTIKVLDGLAPTPICISNISIPLAADGTIQISPQVLNGGSYDNCSAKEELQLEVFPSRFDCRHLGLNIVRFTVTDAAGNSNFCTARVEIQDNQAYCPQGALSGTIRTMDGTPLQGITVRLDGASTTSQKSQSDGRFNFQDLPLGKDYTLTADLDTLPLNGVSTYDIIIISKYILGLQDFQSPYQYWAADVNQSGSITAFDLVHIRQVILGLSPGFPGLPSWRFVDANSVVEDPLVNTLPEVIRIQDLSGSRPQLDFVGIKTGDVSGNAALTRGAATETRNIKQSVRWKAHDKQLQAGEWCELALYTDQNEKLTGFQFTLEWDEDLLTFSDLIPGTIPTLNNDNFGYNKLSEGRLSCSWHHPAGEGIKNDQPVLRLKFQARAAIRLSEVLTLNSSITSAEAYSTAMEILPLSLTFINAEEEQFELYQNFPNPVKDYTTVEFYLPEDGEARFLVYDITGRLIHHTTSFFRKGRNSLQLSRAQLSPTAGIFWYTLQLEDGRRESRKMLLHN